MVKIQIKSERLTPFGGLFSIMEQFDSTHYHLLCIASSHIVWVRGYCRQKWVLQVQIICKFSNERTCKRNKDVQGLSCGFEVYNTFTSKKHPLNSVCKIGTTLHNKIINAEFSLQSASHDSHINHQRSCWCKYAKYEKVS